MAPPQCQVERHTNFKNDKHYEWADFQAQREPVPWKEVARMNTKVNSRKKLTVGNAQKLEPRATATSQPDVQETEQMEHLAIQSLIPF